MLLSFFLSLPVKRSNLSPDRGFIDETRIMSSLKVIGSTSRISMMVGKKIRDIISLKTPDIKKSHWRFDIILILESNIEIEPGR